MPIARTTRPTVVVHGEVVSVSERRTREEKRLFAHAITVRQEGGAQLSVDQFLPRDAGEATPRVPQVLSQWAVIAEVSEGSYGASLNYLREVTDDDLESLSRSVPQLAGK